MKKFFIPAIINYATNCIGFLSIFVILPILIYFGSDLDFGHEKSQLFGLIIAIINILLLILFNVICFKKFFAKLEDKIAINCVVYIIIVILTFIFSPLFGILMLSLFD